VFKFDLTDQRRLAVAAAITVIALPSLWLTSRNEEAGAPNVATAGVVISPESESPGNAVPGVANPMGSPGAAYLDGPPAATSPGVINIAIPSAASGSSVTGTASYRSSLFAEGICQVKDAPFGATVTVTNLDNSRSVTCTASVSPAGILESVVMHPDAFLAIADLADAPVPVEISW
jgi:hypothetical protein